MSQIKRALISVTDKTRVEDVAQCLVDKGVEIISSGGTRKYLEEKGFSIIDIQDVTGNPEAFGGRMKTLSFQVSSGILYRRNHDEDEKQLKELNIKSIDLIVVNLYEFEKTKAKTDQLDEWIEAIDIGGPTMLRAAAKNFNAVTVLPDPKFYHEFILELTNNNETSLKFREKMAIETFNKMAKYDLAIARALSEKANDTVFESFKFDVSNRKELRYGENPHQKAWVIGDDVNSLAGAVSLQGKELSYNNYLDIHAALNACRELYKLSNQYSVTVVKHGNPCGQAVSNSLLQSLAHAWSGDPVSAFGGIISFSHEVDFECAEFFEDKFVEVITAPSFSKDAQKVFAKKKNLRLLTLGMVSHETNEYIVKSIDGGMIIQTSDNEIESTGEIPTKMKFSDSMNDLVSFGVATCKSLKSNAISLVSKSNDTMTLVGAGMGNPNRIVSLQQAVEKAKENGITDFSEILLVSDAFFPFDDGVRTANKYGIKYVVQPGGSIKDKVVVEACDELGMAMLLTGKRHFNH